MASRAERLFEHLQDEEAILSLIGTSENTDSECKGWHLQNGCFESIAKAACGFANSTGVVIVIGMLAKGATGGEPDVVTREAPVNDLKTLCPRSTKGWSPWVPA
jgi:predicted HTH transcriptional regulator